MDTADSANASPLPPIDGNLRIISDCYLHYFQERRKVEEVYIHSLEHLSKRLKTTDVYFENRYDPSLSKNTTREAWAEVRDSLDRECEIRKTLAASWASEAIAPLIELKQTQERIRERIRKDIKNSVTAHTHYAEGTLPKLKRGYMKKSQEVEDLKAAAGDSTSPTSPTVSERGSKPFHVSASRSQLSATAASALQGLAFQGKRQLSQLKTSRSKTGTVKEENRAEHAQRILRAEQDAEHADKEYRQAVNWLETLRLRRVKVLEDGYQSLEAFAHAMSDTMRRTLQGFSDSLMTAYAAQVQSCNRARSYVDKISPEKDASLLTEKIPGLLALAAPKPLYYENFVVGECRDLIFGVALVDYATSKALVDGEIPRIVRICIGEIENRGLEVEGIHQVPGNDATVQELQHRIERDENAFQFDPAVHDVHAISSLLKMYLLKLPEPVFKISLRDRVQHTRDNKKHESNDFALLRAKIQQLPYVHQATLKAIVEHLANITSHSNKNKMNAKEIATIFGPVLFGGHNVPGKDDPVGKPAYEDTLLEDLISHADVLFPTTVPELTSSPIQLEGPVPAEPGGSSHVEVARPATPPPAYTEGPDQRAGGQMALPWARGSQDLRTIKDTMRDIAREGLTHLRAASSVSLSSRISGQPGGTNSLPQTKPAEQVVEGVDMEAMLDKKVPPSVAPSPDAFDSKGVAAPPEKPSLAAQATIPSRLSPYPHWTATNASSSTLDSLPSPKHDLEIVIPSDSAGFSRARSPAPSIAFTDDSQLTPTDSQSSAGELSAWGMGLSDELWGVSQEAQHLALAEGPSRSRSRTPVGRGYDG